jgi:very-short-patch-repair endonuclease
MTPPERRLWNALKQRPDGFKFRKQHEHGPYYLDFFCYEAAVAVEVDGFAHDLGMNPQRDERRDAWLASRGIRAVRVGATDVRDNLEGVVAYIVEACRQRAPHNLLPSISRGGGSRSEVEGSSG